MKPKDFDLPDIVRSVLCVRRARRTDGVDPWIIERSLSSALAQEGMLVAASTARYSAPRRLEWRKIDEYGTGRSASAQNEALAVRSSKTVPILIPLGFRSGAQWTAEEHRNPCVGPAS